MWGSYTEWRTEIWKDEISQRNMTKKWEAPLEQNIENGEETMFRHMERQDSFRFRKHNYVLSKIHTCKYKPKHQSSLNWQMAATKNTYSKYYLWVATLEMPIILETCQGYYLSKLLFNIISYILSHVLIQRKKSKN